MAMTHAMILTTITEGGTDTDEIHSMNGLLTETEIIRKDQVIRSAGRAREMIDTLTDIRERDQEKI